MFISYTTHSDADLAARERLCDILGPLCRARTLDGDPWKVWVDDRSLHAGDDWNDRLTDALGYMTPQAVHYGHAPALREFRQTALDAAFLAAPRRFKGRRPTPSELPTAVWINPPSPEVSDTEPPSPGTVNSLTCSAAWHQT